MLRLRFGSLITIGIVFAAILGGILLLAFDALQATRDAIFFA